MAKIRDRQEGLTPLWERRLECKEYFYINGYWTLTHAQFSVSHEQDQVCVSRQTDKPKGQEDSHNRLDVDCKWICAD